MTDFSQALIDAADEFDDLVYEAPRRWFSRSQVRVPAGEADALIERMRPLAGAAAQPAFRALADLVASAERVARGELILHIDPVMEALDALRPDSASFLDAYEEDGDLEAYEEDGDGAGTGLVDSGFTANRDGLSGTAPLDEVPLLLRWAAILIDAATALSLAGLVIWLVFREDYGGIWWKLGVAAMVVVGYGPVTMGLSNGRTLGMFVFGLRLVRDDGSRITVCFALARDLDSVSNAASSLGYPGMFVGAICFVFSVLVPGLRRNISFAISRSAIVRSRDTGGQDAGLPVA